MNQELVRFRKAASRENRGRRDGQGRPACEASRRPTSYAVFVLKPFPEVPNAALPWTAVQLPALVQEVDHLVRDVGRAADAGRQFYERQPSRRRLEDSEHRRPLVREDIFSRGDRQGRAGPLFWERHIAMEKIAVAPVVRAVPDDLEVHIVPHAL